MEITLKLNNPITDEQWDAITDVDFEHTDRIWFHTKNGKDVEFVKRKWILCTERLPDKNGYYLVTGQNGSVNTLKYTVDDQRWYGGRRPLAWMETPEPWKGNDKK